MRKLVDWLKPKGEALQIRLLKNGKPVGGIYVDDKKEVRSPSLQGKKK